MGKQPLKLLTKVTQKAKKNDTKFKEKHQQDEERLVKKNRLLRIQSSLILELSQWFR